MDKQLKILFQDTEIPYLLNDADYPTGGACVRTYTFSMGLIELGHIVGVLTWKGANDFVKDKKEIDLVETYDDNKGIPILRWVYYRFPVLFNRVKAYKPDVFICKSPGNALGIMSIVCWLLRIKLVFMVTNDIVADNRWKKKKNKANRFFQWLGLRGPSSIFCQNDFQLGIYSKKYPSKNVFKVSNPFYSNNNFVKTESKFERKYIAWLGIFQYQKNIPALLTIVKNSPNLQFIIAGVTGSNSDENTNAAIRELRTLKNAKFAGYLKRKQLSTFLSGAIALLNTSFYEGFSNTFLEAFAVGTPVISLGVNPDKIITKYNLGFIVNENEVGDKINYLIANYHKNNMEKRIIKYLNDNHNYESLSMALSNKLILLSE